MIKLGGFDVYPLIMAVLLFIGTFSWLMVVFCLVRISLLIAFGPLDESFEIHLDSETFVVRTSLSAITLYSFNVAAVMTMLKLLQLAVFD